MRLAIAWAVVVACAAILLSSRIFDGFPIETGLLGMLPPSKSSSTFSEVETHLSATLNRRLLVLTSHENEDVARDAANKLGMFLVDRGLAQPISANRTAEQGRQMLRALAPYAPGLLAYRDREELLAGKSEAVARRALSRSLLPLQTVDGASLRADPLLFSAAFLADIPRSPSPLAPRPGGLEGRDGERHVVLRIFNVRGEPFDVSAQSPLVEGLSAQRAALTRDAPALRIMVTGAALFAAAGSQSAIDDMSRIGTIATLTLLLLLTVAFRSVGAVFLIALPAMVGTVVGATAVVLVFSSVHGLALVFGTTLIGTAVDYAIHYVSARYTAGDPSARRQSVRMGTLLGLTTTVIGYLAILPSPFPALQELALFSATGLAAAWITMILWLPHLDRAPQLQPPAAIERATRWIVATRRPLAATGISCLIVLVAIGCSKLAVVDDIRRFQSLPEDMQRDEAEIRRIAGVALAPLLLTVAATDMESALQREEALHQRLRDLGHEAEGVARYVPSAARQVENTLLVKNGLPGEFLGRLSPALLRSLERPHAPMTPMDLPPLLASRLADLQVPVSGGVLHLVRLFDASARDPIAAAIAGLEGVALLDVPGAISDSFAAQRQRTIILLFGLVLLTFVIATIRYGWRRGIRTMLAPAIAILATPPILALGGEPFSFFNSVGLLLVVALGIDYAFCWSEADKVHRLSTALAILISMLTTVITFGLLTLSSTEALRGFGATVAVGTLLCALSAPLVATRKA